MVVWESVRDVCRAGSDLVPVGWYGVIEVKAKIDISEDLFV